MIKRTSKQAKCDECGKLFMARVKYPQPAKRFCSLGCRKSKSLPHPCLRCDKITINEKFCNIECATQFNSKLREKLNYCIDCDNLIQNNSTQCRTCHISSISRDWSKVTLSQLKIELKGQAHARIRQLARRIYKLSGRPQICSACGYDKHYEVAHIKAINSFSNNTLISTINDVANLQAFCRNHHWEQEHPNF